MYRWYKRIFKIWKPHQQAINNYVLGWLPIITILIILGILITLASFDVVSSPLFITFYILMGLVWFFAGKSLMFYAFDISLVDDVLNNANKAALVTFAGGMIGIILIYSGANIGDGPGFWCVIVAGAIGTMIWVILVKIYNKITGVIERVLVGRDLSTGIRFGSFLTATGIILARASGGDWVDFIKTIVDFKDGWVVLPLFVTYLLIEIYYKNKMKKESFSSSLGGSIFWSIFLIIIAIVCAIYVAPPLPQNPIYSLILGGII
jgi:hypothetical protein